jgi:Tol biopolymer transport system component
MDRATSRARGRAGVALAGTALLLGTLALPSTAQPTANPDHRRQWGPAESVDPGGRLGINTAAGEGCPYETPDGHMLFFASNRTGSIGPGTNDIWVSFRPTRHSPWGVPVNVGAPVNSTANDFCPTPLPGNQLLFVSSRGNQCGGPGNNPDIYYSRLQPNGVWLEPRHLGCDVNSGFEEFSPSLVQAEGRTLLYFSSNRLGTHDIFVTALREDGTWSAAEPVAELNSGQQDSRPNVRKDGLEIVFDSTRDGGLPQIFAATRSSVFKRWSEPRRLGANVNINDFGQTRPTISRDGERLYFGSSRPDAETGTANDLYVATRKRPGKH